MKRDENFMKSEVAVQYGYSSDPRKRRRQHREAAKKLLSGGGFFTGFKEPGSTFHTVAMWHLKNARMV